MQLFKFNLLLILLLLPLTILAEDKPSMAVLDFRNDTAAGWWSRGVGNDLSGMLTNELAAGKQFRMVERDKLDAVLTEQNLRASERINPATSAKIGNMTGAQYLVTATVSAFEHDVSENNGGISYKGFSIGGKKEDAYIAVDLRVIDSTTGEVYDTRTIEARASSGGIKLRGYKNGLGGKFGKSNNTPVGKAIRAVVYEIAGYLECSMITPSGRCMNNYDAKEDRRRDNLRDAIKLD